MAAAGSASAMIPTSAPDIFMAPASEVKGGDADMTTSRSTTQYRGMKKKFSVDTRADFNRQFSHIYAMRLREMREMMLKKLEKRAGNLPVQNKIIGGQPGQECYIVGTIYKEMKLKPCILDELEVRDHER